MPAKSIAELSAGSNLVANIAPVADPVTGVAGKSSISSLTYSTTNPLSIFTNLSSVGPQCGLSAISVNGAIIAIENNIEVPNSVGIIDPSIVINGSIANVTSSFTPFSVSSLTINSYVIQGISVTDTTLLNNTCNALVPNAIISISGGGVVGQIDNQPQLTEKTIAYPSMKQWITNPGNSISPSYYDWNFSAPELLQIGYFSIGKFCKSISIPKCNFMLQIQEAAGQTTTSLKSLSFPLVKYIGTNYFQDKNDWEVFDMPELVAVIDGAPFAKKPCPNLLTFNYPKLEAIYQAGSGVVFPAKAGFSFTLPALESIGYNSTNVNFVFGSSGSAGYIGFPTDFAATGSGNYSISLPSLKKVASQTLAVGAGNAQMSFYGSANWPGPLCNSLNIGTGLTNVTGGIYIDNQPLNQASVDNLLVSYANLDGTGGKTLYNGTMPSITITGPASAPSATGLAAKSTLVSRGVTVTTN